MSLLRSFGHKKQNLLRQSGHKIEFTAEIWSQKKRIYYENLVTKSLWRRYGHRKRESTTRIWSQKVYGGDMVTEKENILREFGHKKFIAEVWSQN
ncbi:hypothetical protein C1N61_27465 (plasmid) [Priestia aryabhattai]